MPIEDPTATPEPTPEPAPEPILLSATKAIRDGIEYFLTVEEEAAFLAQQAADQPTLAARIADAIKGIDADVDAIYGAVLGNRAAEYELAEYEAKAYIAAAYAGTVPATVQSWATATAQTAQWAADDIAATATAWRDAQAAIRAARLLRKEQARNAPDAETLGGVLVQWAGFVAYMRGQLGLPAV